MPLAIGIFFSLIGVVFMIVWRLGPGREFFRRHGGESVPPEIARDGALAPAAPGAA